MSLTYQWRLASSSPWYQYRRSVRSGAGVYQCQSRLSWFPRPGKRSPDVYKRQVQHPSYDCGIHIPVQIPPAGMSVGDQRVQNRSGSSGIRRQGCLLYTSSDNWLNSSAKPLNDPAAPGPPWTRTNLYGAFPYKRTISLFPFQIYTTNFHRR